MPRTLDNLTLHLIAKQHPTVGIAMYGAQGDYAIFILHARCVAPFMEYDAMEEGDYFALYGQHVNEADVARCFECEAPTTLPPEELLCRLNTSTSTG